MRRVLIAALIGGFIGFVLLLQMACDKAGCWGYQSIHFSKIVMLPATAVKIADLVHSARMLIFQLEIINSGCEFLVRGAGAGIILLMCHDVLQKQFRKSRLISSLYSPAANEVLISTLWFFGLLLGMCMLLTMLWCSIQLSQYAFGAWLSPISIATVLPAFVLHVLCLAAAFKKGLFLWQLVPTEEKKARIARNSKVSIQILLPLLGVIIGSYFMLLCEGTWGRASNISMLAPLSDSYKSSVFAEGFYVLVSAWLASLTVFFVETLNLKIETGLSFAESARRCAFSAFFICACLHLILPAIHMNFFFPPDGVSIRQFFMDVCVWTVAASTVPSSLFGLAVAIAPNLKSKMDMCVVELTA